MIHQFDFFGDVVPNTDTVKTEEFINISPFPVFVCKSFVCLIIMSVIVGRKQVINWVW